RMPSGSSRDSRMCKQHTIMKSDDVDTDCAKSSGIGSLGVLGTIVCHANPITLRPPAAIQELERQDWDRYKTPYLFSCREIPPRSCPRAGAAVRLSHHLTPGNRQVR